jgi:hypothetical protein
MENEFGSEYASSADTDFKVKYRASCHCNAVQYEVCADPVDAKICHCLACQKLHGAPMQWAAIFHKRDVRITKGVDCLKFYNSERNIQARVLPCKVSCALCSAPIADEGRRMWLAFPSLFDFGGFAALPETFKPTCHLFYGSRVMDMDDELPKWSGHKNHSVRLSG